LARLRASRSGATAAIFALSVPVMVGGLAFAADIAYYRVVQNRMQIAVDGAALSGVVEIEENGPDAVAVTGRAVEFVAANVPAEFGAVTQDSDVEIGTYTMDGTFTPGESATANAVRVSALRSPDRGNPARQFFSQFFGTDRATIAATAIAARPTNVFYQPPESDWLDPEAGDYNEIYAYCFDTLGGGSPSERRSKMTLVSNNLPQGTDIVALSGGVITQNPPNPPNSLVWPVCNARGQTLSFRLRNIRHVKSNPVLWGNPSATISGRQPGRPEFNYYTDTVLVDNVEQFDLQGFNILETVLCDTAAECGPGPESIIPRGRNRALTRLREPSPCQPGRYMYFGFEDRPPDQPGPNASWLDPAWTDSDYDDIRIIMRCPASGRLGDARVRLVK
jgi:Flp pilus assembly protein TadG